MFDTSIAVAAVNAAADQFTADNPHLVSVPDDEAWEAPVTDPKEDR